jgi:hypothetical protein
VKYHNFLTINKRDNKEEELIELCNNGNIRIWNFHTGLLLKEINLHSICNYGGVVYANGTIIIYLWDVQIKQ